MITVTIGGREIPLAYTTLEMLTIQEDIGPLQAAIAWTSGKNPEDEEDQSKYGSKEHLKTLAKMIRILGNAGLEISGQEGNLDEKQILRGISPGEIYVYSNACLDSMFEGMKSEIAEETAKKPKGRVDKGLEEMKKKDGAAG